MRSRTYLVAALLGSFGGLLATTQRAVADRDFDREDGAEAEAAVLIKLDDVIQAAVTQSPDLMRAKLDRAAARGSAGAARHDQAWMLTGSASYKREGVSDHKTVGPFQVVGTDALNGSVGLGRNLPSGGSVAVELGVAHVDTEYNIPIGVDLGTGSGSGSGSSASQVAPNGTPDHYTQIQTRAQLTLKQPLARGFGPDVALAGEKRADLAFAASTLKAQLAAEELVRDLVISYWELAYASFELDTRNQSLQLAKEQEKLTHAELRAGQAAPSSLSAVTYEILVRQEAALKTELDLEKKSLDLRRKAGLEVGRRDLLIRPGEKFEVGDAEWDIEDVLAQSRRANRRLATVAIEKKIADVDVNVANNGMLPQVDLSLTGALVGTGDTTDGAVRGLQSGDGYQLVAGLSVSFELSGAAKAAHDTATARRRRLDVDRADLERQIDVEVVSAAKMVLSSRTRVMLAEKAIDVAKDNLKAERQLFEAGKSTNFNVMQRQTQLIDANLARGRAIADYHVAVATLQFLSGTLLDQYRVNVRPHSSKLVEEN